MTNIFKGLAVGLCLVSLSACDPMGVVPSVSEQVAAANAAGLPAGGLPALGLPGDASQCAQSAATLADPTSTPAQREGATRAAQANGC